MPGVERNGKCNAASSPVIGSICVKAREICMTGWDPAFEEKTIFLHGQDGGSLSSVSEIATEAGAAADVPSSAEHQIWCNLLRQRPEGKSNQKIIGG